MKKKKKPPKSGYFAYPMYKTVHFPWFIHKNHIHKIKSRYGFSMKPIYPSTIVVTCMFLYLIANIWSTKQNMSNSWSPSHLACSQRLHRSLSLGKGLRYGGKHVSWMFSLKQSPTALKLSLGFRIHNSLRKNNMPLQFSLHIQQNYEHSHFFISIYTMLKKRNVKILGRGHFCMWLVSKLGWKKDNQNGVYTRLSTSTNNTIHPKSFYYTLYSRWVLNTHC